MATQKKDEVAVDRELFAASVDDSIPGDNITGSSLEDLAKELANTGEFEDGALVTLYKKIGSFKYSAKFALEEVK